MTNAQRMEEKYEQIRNEMNGDEIFGNFIQENSDITITITLRRELWIRLAKLPFLDEEE